MAGDNAPIVARDRRGLVGPAEQGSHPAIRVVETEGGRMIQGLVAVRTGRREEDGDASPVVVRLARTGRATPAELERVYVASTTGPLTPLAQVASLKFERAVPEMPRYDRTRSG